MTCEQFPVKVLILNDRDFVFYVLHMTTPPHLCDICRVIRNRFVGTAKRLAERLAFGTSPCRSRGGVVWHKRDRPYALASWPNLRNNTRRFPVHIIIQ